MEWPRIPLPGWPDGDEDGAADELAASAARGRELAALLDSDTPVPGVTTGALRPEAAAVAVPSTTDGGNMAGDDFALTAGWGHFGQGEAVMPGQGRVVERAYTADERAALGEAARPLGDTTFDVHLNGRAYWRNVPAAVWGYKLGGYQVLKKWLSYREQNVLGRALKPEEVQHFTDTARRIGGILGSGGAEMKMPRWGRRCLRFLRSIVRRLLRPIRSVVGWDGFWWVAGMVAVLAVGVFLSWRFWDELRGDQDSLSTTIRNLGLVIGGVIAILLAIWRSTVSERQADTAQQSLLNERYERRAEMLGSDVLSVRLGGIYALQRFAQEHPKEYHVQVLGLLCAFVRHPKEDEGYQRMLAEKNADPKTFSFLREDVQAVMDWIGSRGEAQIAIEKDAKFELDLKGADLVHGQFIDANLSGARLQEANLSRANIASTDLSGAYINYAVLKGAELTDVDLTDARFGGH